MCLTEGSIKKRTVATTETPTEGWFLNTISPLGLIKVLFLHKSLFKGRAFSKGTLLFVHVVCHIPDENFLLICYFFVDNHGKQHYR